MSDTVMNSSTRQPQSEDLPVTLGAIDINLAYKSDTTKEQNLILKDLSLHIRSGEICSIIGSSGVGKSSLLRVLAGLQKPQSGLIYLHGKKLTGPNKSLGFVFQNHSLLPWLNLEENVGFGLSFRNQAKLDKASRNQRVQQAIAEVGLTQAKDKYPQELSGGMAQRTALARCLAREPEILLMDEPFSALDEVSRAQMQALLLDIIKRRNTAVILVTHDIDEAILLSDRILLIGGQPGQLINEWKLPLPYPRDIADKNLIDLRIQILQALRNTHS